MFKEKTIQGQAKKAISQLKEAEKKLDQMQNQILSSGVLSRKPTPKELALIKQMTKKKLGNKYSDTLIDNIINQICH